jgi:hypothetical protein
MEFIYITNIKIKADSHEFKRIREIHHIQYDLLEVIETQSAIPFVLFNKFTMSGIEFVVVDTECQIVVNSDKNRLEYITDVFLRYSNEDTDDDFPF